MKPAREDIAFRDRFEAGDVAPAAFNHYGHLRLAFVYLCEDCVEVACARMRAALLQFLARNSVPEGKFHETMTQAWVQAVRHFMERAGNATSFEAFLAADERLLDTQIMLSHYSRARLFSEQARACFLRPDLQAIPQYA